jgi:hypothetical protein
VAWKGGLKNIYRLLVGESESRRSLGRAMGGWKDDIKINNRGVNVTWMGLNWLKTGRGNEPWDWKN